MTRKRKVNPEYQALIKARLKMFLKKRGKMKDTLEEAGVPYKTFLEYCANPRRSIKTEWIASICQTLNISTDEILLKRSEGE